MLCSIGCRTQLRLGLRQLYVFQNSRGSLNESARRTPLRSNDEKSPKSRCIKKRGARSRIYRSDPSRGLRDAGRAPLQPAFSGPGEEGGIRLRASKKKGKEFSARSGARPGKRHSSARRVSGEPSDLQACHTAWPVASAADDGLRQGIVDPPAAQLVGLCRMTPNVPLMF